MPDFDPASSPPLTSSTSSSTHNSPPFLIRLARSVGNLFQLYLDKSVPHTTGRWIGLAVMMLLYCIRVYALQGFYIVTYGLGIFLLNLLIGFLSPLDEDLLGGDNSSDGPLLPTTDQAEFKPFIRRLPEFKFWYACLKAICIAIMMTFFSLFDVPVFWPILLIYFIILFVLTMKRQIKHMIKHKYIPFNLGKKKYTGGATNGNKRVAEDIRAR